MKIKSFSDLDSFITILDYEMPLRLYYYSDCNKLEIRYYSLICDLNLEFALTKTDLDSIIDYTVWAYFMVQEGVCSGF